MDYLAITSQKEESTHYKNILLIITMKSQKKEKTNATILRIVAIFLLQSRNPSSGEYTWHSSTVFIKVK